MMSKLVSGLNQSLVRISVIVLACASVCFLLFPTNNVVAPSDYLVIPGFRVEKPHIHVRFP